MKLVSIIVPIYKVEEYLDRCILSIVNQTYQNLEIILVDDGSPDNCPQMCDAWAEEDTRIKVIHKTNGGLSDARNAGLEIATGEYICFVDSDDIIRDDYVELHLKAIVDNNANLSACGVLLFTNLNEIETSKNDFSATPYTVEGALNTLINGCGFRAIACNKLYHRNLIINEKFEVGKYHEDEFFTYRILAKSVNPVLIDENLYYYFQRESSIVNSVSEKHLDALDAYIERLSFLKTHFPTLYRADIPSICKSCINLYLSINTFPLSTRDISKKRIKNSRSAIKISFKEFCSYSIKDMIYILGSSKTFIGMFCKIIAFKRK